MVRPTTPIIRTPQVNLVFHPLHPHVTVIHFVIHQFTSLNPHLLVCLVELGPFFVVLNSFTQRQFRRLYKSPYVRPFLLLVSSNPIPGKDQADFGLNFPSIRWTKTAFISQVNTGPRLSPFITLAPNVGPVVASTGEEPDSRRNPPSKYIHRLSDQV